MPSIEFSADLPDSATLAWLAERFPRAARLIQWRIIGLDDSDADVFALER